MDKEIKKASRQSYGEALVELGRENEAWKSGCKIPRCHSDRGIGIVDTVGSRNDIHARKLRHAELSSGEP